MPKVLLADDSITIQKVVDIVLREKGFEVKSVNTGEDALMVIEDFAPDIVLADVQMPGISGYQLTEQIRLNDATRSLPVILLAGAFEPLDLPLANKVGANAHLIKPFESKELVSMINELLTNKPSAPAPKPADAEELLDIDFSDIMGEASHGEEFAEAVEEADVTEADVFDATIEPEEIPAAVDAESLELMAEDISEVMEATEEIAAAEPGAVEAFEITQEAPVAAVPAINSSQADINATLREAIDAKLTALDVEGALVRAMEARLATIIEPADMKQIIREAIAPSLNDAIERILWELMPEMVERMLLDAIKDTVAPLKKEIENVIWDTVPDIAENLIKQEIDSIRSGN